MWVQLQADHLIIGIISRNVNTNKSLYLYINLLFNEYIYSDKQF